MLGWTDMSLGIIEQICLANESEGHGTIVILAPEDKEKMEEQLENAVSSDGGGLRLCGTEVLFRSGNPLLESHLRRTSASVARAVIVLSRGFDHDEADGQTVRQVLALRTHFNKMCAPDQKPHVVCEVRNLDNMHLVVKLGCGLVEPLCAHDMIGRLMVKCSRSIGLAQVLETLMGFEGDEFYLREWPELRGLRFLDILTRFDDAVPVGIKRGDKVTMSPPNALVLEDGDEILVLAEDDNTYCINGGGDNIQSGREADGEEDEEMLFCVGQCASVDSEVETVSGGQTNDKLAEMQRGYSLEMLAGAELLRGSNTPVGPPCVEKESGRGGNTPAGPLVTKKVCQRGKNATDAIPVSGERSSGGNNGGGGSGGGEAAPERILFCGWRRDMAIMITDLDRCVC
jgi:hypothetical protein